MSAITFVTWAGGGNVPPAVAVAAELGRRGHDVEMMGHGSLGDTVADAGVSFAGFGRARPWDAAHPGSPLQMLRMLGDRAMGAEVLARARQRDADLVVVDCLLFGVMRSLRDAGVGYVALEHLCDGFLRRSARGPMGVALRLGGIRALELLDGADARIAMTVPQLDRGHGAVTHVGPAITAVPSAATEPAVLISLSTYAFPGMVKVWQRILDAVDGLAARVVVTTGPRIDPAALRVPAGVEVHRWLDHAAVLPEMTIVVGHGGHGTTVAALAHGVPVLVLPLDATSDQPFMGEMLETLGAGRRVSKRSRPATIRAAIDALIVDGPHRDAARRLGAEIRRTDGGRGGADAVESMLGRSAIAPGRVGPATARPPGRTALSPPDPPGTR